MADYKHACPIGEERTLTPLPANERTKLVREVQKLTAQALKKEVISKKEAEDLVTTYDPRTAKELLVDVIQAKKKLDGEIAKAERRAYRNGGDAAVAQMRGDLIFPKLMIFAANVEHSYVCMRGMQLRELADLFKKESVSRNAQ